MEYTGKLYAKIGNKYAEISHTSEFEKIEAQLKIKNQIIYDLKQSFLREVEHFKGSELENKKHNEYITAERARFFGKAFLMAYDNILTIEKKYNDK